jgi:hypothetical protein
MGSTELKHTIGKFIIFLRIGRTSRFVLAQFHVCSIQSVRVVVGFRGDKRSGETAGSPQGRFLPTLRTAMAAVQIVVEVIWIRLGAQAINKAEFCQRSGTNRRN